MNAVFLLSLPPPPTFPSTHLSLSILSIILPSTSFRPSTFPSFLLPSLPPSLSLPACLPACLPAYLPVCLPACLFLSPFLFCDITIQTTRTQLTISCAMYQQETLMPEVLGKGKH